MHFWRNFHSYPYWLPILISLNENVLCDPISNHKFNSSFRDYFAEEDAVIPNKTEVKALQNLDNHIYRKKPLYSSKIIRFQETPDNALSGSSYSRGFHHGEYPGSYSYDYEVGPYDGGVHGHHEHHHQPHYGHHVEHYHKHHDHAFAAKAFLWPLAGLALLGAAATLVTNPVLLQLGVVTGRKRRSINYDSSTASVSNILSNNWDSFGNLTTQIEQAEESTKKRNVLFRDSKRKAYRRTKSLLTTTPKSSQMTLDIPPKNGDYWSNHRYVPIPLMMKKND